jgi:hypothetical protein
MAALMWLVARLPDAVVARLIHHQDDANGSAGL